MKPLFILFYLLMIIIFPNLSYSGSVLILNINGHDSTLIESSNAEQVSAQASNTFPQLEKDAVMLANYTRKNPAFIANIISKDVSAALDSIPVYSPFWALHKWALRSDYRLSEAVKKHSEDMFSKGYLSSISPDGINPEQRAISQGYKPLEIHEYISVMVPRNFIAPEEAFLELYTRFFYHEVDSFINGTASIFDYHMRDIGVSFASGKQVIEGKSVSVYKLVISYGLSTESLIEDELMRLINTARSDYNRFLEYFEIDKESAARALDGFLMINLNGGLDPLIFYSSAENLQAYRLEDDTIVFRDEVNILQNFEASISYSSDPDPYSAAYDLFQQLVMSGDMQGVKMILCARSSAGVVKINADSSTEEMKVSLNFAIGRSSDRDNILTGNILTSQDDDPFGPARVPEDLKLELLSGDNTVSVFYPRYSGSFRMNQITGSNMLYVRHDEEIVSKHFYSAGQRPTWKEVTIKGDR
ncbi:CAP domain-containing protein [Desulfonatronovibrio magnus]|uniref:CAP domain-containing protein n=1 Tax=Desulfonatronovibrio magnus TaxID=698827 RepID=UPI0012FBEAD5|nr:hypothetical protein [Desulfonatronovibrio magnus]